MDKVCPKCKQEFYGYIQKCPFCNIELEPIPKGDGIIFKGEINEC